MRERRPRCCRTLLQPSTALAYAHRCTEWRRRAMHARSPTCTHACTHAQARAGVHARTPRTAHSGSAPADRQTNTHTKPHVYELCSTTDRHWPGTGPAWHWPVCSTTDRRCRPARRCASSTASPPRRAPPPVAAPRPRRLPFSHSAVIAPARRACHCAAALRHKPRGDRLSDQRRRWCIHRAAHRMLSGAHAPPTLRPAGRKDPRAARATGASISSGTLAPLADGAVRHARTHARSALASTKRLGGLVQCGGATRRRG